MASNNNGNGKGDALIEALDRMSYEWLMTNAPELVVAISNELPSMTPQGIRFIVQRHVGPDREGLALRCEQAARHIHRLSN
jgi:hypothetical protein